MIDVQHLTKRFGSTVAVDDLSFSVQPGVVTGFLGPNGAGKSTTMRLILGLDTPTSGQATIDGQAYAQLAAPLQRVGALLDASGVHGGLRLRDHLRWVARASGIPSSRVNEVLEQVGLEDAAHRKVGGFSLGMRQRAGIATVLMGDPDVLLFDEPVNGLDPEGVLWIRTLLRKLAAQGKTVLVSSHLMSEMEDTADHVIVVGRGKLIADVPMADLVRGAAHRVRVVTPDANRLRDLLGEAQVELDDDGALSVSGMEAAQIGQIAADAGVTLHELTPKTERLESVFMQLTRDSVDYRSGDAK